MTIYNSSLNKLFSIKEPFSKELKITALTSTYLLIHDKIKQQAFICDKQGHFLTQPFPLSQNGQVILSKNRIYRLDNLEDKVKMEYLKI